MHTIDWAVMLAVLFGIVAYGIWKTRNVASTKSYLLGDKDLPWWTIGLSVMATQASAITFLSTPGQAYDEGMGFVQFYFGLPIAMVILCVFVLPIYYRLNVYTAYEYLEGRFGIKTRTLTACLFLVSRGLAAGITIYAPAIILSNIMGWDLNTTIFFIGGLVIIYTVAGGTKAVSHTQKQQMIVILGGMVVAAFILVFQLPPDITFSEAVGVAGQMGKLEVIDLEFDLSNKYNVWSGILGGTFLFLSYFGTDQSQVQRYLSGKSLKESRLGLLFNGIVKVPMQFLILFVGILVFIFFQFQQPPIHFNNANLKNLENTEYASQLEDYQKEFDNVFAEKQVAVRELTTAMEAQNETAVEAARTNVQALHDQDLNLREQVRGLIIEQDEDANIDDSDYVFINFITKHLPIGLIGLLLAVIFSAAMSSTSSELSALATTTVVDIYRRSFKKDGNDQHYLRASKMFTVLWGIMALIFAASASLFDNLIEAVNIVGSLFYGVILGIFLVAFFIKRVGGTAVFASAILVELIVITIFTLDKYEIISVVYLWLNLIGSVLVILFGLLFQSFLKKQS